MVRIFNNVIFFTIQSVIGFLVQSVQFSFSDKNEVELVEFLDQEIDTEQDLHKSRHIPSKIDDFEVKLDGAEVSLVKTTPNET